MCVILCRSLCKYTVSNAFEMSSGIDIVPSVFLLKHVMIVVFIYGFQSWYSGVFLF